MPNQMQQMTFNLRDKQEQTFSTFVCQEPDSLQPIYNFLATKELEKIFYLWGPSGAGKSHLLQSSNNYINKVGQKSMYICLKNTTFIKPEIFEDLEQFSLICLDDIDLVLADNSWQEAIYYCLELAENYNVKIMVSSKNNIGETDFARPESYSRLAASYRHKIDLLPEELLFKALTIRAKQRQIPISDEVFKYISHYGPRDSKSIFKLLDHLSDYSLIHKKSITKKMVREVLAINFNLLDQIADNR